MTIPDLSNASPGDVYQGPDGQLWVITRVGRVGVNYRAPAHEPCKLIAGATFGSEAFEGWVKVE